MREPEPDPFRDVWLAVPRDEYVSGHMIRLVQAAQRRRCAQAIEVKHFTAVMLVYTFSRCLRGVLPVALCSAICLAPLGFAYAQDVLTAELLPTGVVNVMSGGKLLATLSLNAHGPEWKHAPQAEATATVQESGVGPAKTVHGTLPVANSDGGAIRFVETVELGAEGLLADYTLGPTQALSLNGLQVSLLLPADRFAGKTMVIHAPPAGAAGAETASEETVQTITLPEKLDQKQWQLFTGPASKIEIAAGTDDAITVVPRAYETGELEAAGPAMFAIQDLRRWDENTVEVRLYLLMADKGKWLSAWDKMQVALGITFSRQLRWQ